MTDQKNDTATSMNERLNDAGLLDNFYRAATRKDRSEMIALLMSVALDRAQAEEATDALLQNSAFFES